MRTPPRGWLIVYGRHHLSPMAAPISPGTRHGGVCRAFAPLMPQQVAAGIVDSGRKFLGDSRIAMAIERAGSKTRGRQGRICRAAPPRPDSLSMDLLHGAPIALPPIAKSICSSFRARMIHRALKAHGVSWRW